MKRISSKFTLFQKATSLVAGTLFLSVSIAIFFSKTDDIQTKIIVLIVCGIAGTLFLWTGIKSCHISLIKEGINLRGFIQSEDVLLNNIYDLIDLWFVYPHITILKFNRKTRFGKTIIFYPKKTGFINSQTIGLNTLKRALGK